LRGRVSLPSGKAPQTLHERMVRRVDNPVLEGDAEQFLERQLWPHRLGYRLLGREHLISTERHVRFEPHPLLGRELGGLPSGAPPFVSFAVEPRKADGPNTHNTLA